MAKFTWTQSNPTALKANLEGIEERVRQKAADIVREVVGEAAVKQAELLEAKAAHTGTGERRVETAGKSSKYGSISPGRVDSGVMINGITSKTLIDGDTVRGEWGWFNPEPYFAEQDWGEDRIPAAHSLLNSYVEAREKFFDRMKKEFS